MFHVMSQIGGLLAPSNGIAMMGLLGLIVMVATPWRRVGLALAGGGICGILAAGLLPVGNWAILPLEQRFPAFVDDGRPITGIIVLSGALEVTRSAARRGFAVNGAAERIFAFMDLARRYPGARLVYSGGNSRIGSRLPPEAWTATEYLKTIGLPGDRLTIETRSHNTWENARETRNLVRPSPGERWLLVTSAWHMPRAMGSFEQAGFRVIPYPVDFQTNGARDLMQPFTVVGQGLERLDLAAREWLGLIGYRLSGRTGALFPGPGAEPKSGDAKLLIAN
ncbi:YdcF family protein [Bosea sp. NPDC055353]